MVLWDKSLKTSAVPPKLAKYSPAHDVPTHVFPDNGGKARRILPPFGASSALRSPFGKVISAALAPPAALWERRILRTPLHPRFRSFELGDSVRRSQPFVKQQKSFLRISQLHACFPLEKEQRSIPLLFGIPYYAPAVKRPYSSPISMWSYSPPLRSVGAMISKPASFWKIITKSDPPKRKYPSMSPFLTV